MDNSLFEQITNCNNPLSKFIINGKQTACIYPKPYDKPEIVRWFYSRNNGCQVFYSCSKEISEIIDSASWADVSWDFTVFVEHELMPFCVENTDWQPCHRYLTDYDKKAFERDNKGQFTGSFDMGCGGSVCHCEPFGEGDFTYGIADINEFNLSNQNLCNN